MIDAQDDDFTQVLTDPVEDPIRATAGGPDAVEVVTQRLADAVGA